MKIKDTINILYIESWIKIYKETYDGEDTIWEGYLYELPNEYMELEINCLVPMYDYVPMIGIELKED